MADPDPTSRLVPAHWLGRVVEVVIDRPLGSLHPRFAYPYPVNYGFVPGTLAPDGCEIDAYVLGPRAPVERSTAPVVAVITRADDVEDKLVVASMAVSPAQVAESVAFQERWFNSTVHTADGSWPLHGLTDPR